jgi:hypothetical protein
MNKHKFNPSLILVIAFILATALLRVLFNLGSEDGQIPEMALWSPVGAMAIFGGATINKAWKAFLFPMGTLLISDLILRFTVFSQFSDGFLYPGWYWVYGTFILMILASRLIMTRLTVGRFLTTVLVATLIHWIATDIPVWYGSTLYSQNFEGFILCLEAAIPFELKFIGATLVYGSALFGGLYWLMNKTHRPVRQEA